MNMGARVEEERNQDPLISAALDQLKAKKRAFGRRLKWLLEYDDRPEEKFLSNLPLDEYCLGAFLSGERKPQPTTLTRIAAYFEIDIEILWPASDALWPSE